MDLACALRKQQSGSPRPHAAHSARAVSVPSVILCLLSIALGRSQPPQSEPQLVVQAGHTSAVFGVAFSPDGRWLATAGADDWVVKLWDFETGLEIRSLAGHTSAVSSVAFSLDGRLLASGSWDQTVKLWDVTSGREIQTLLHDGSVLDVAFSRDGRLASASGDQSVKLWDPSTGRTLRTLTGHTKTVTSVAFSADGTALVSGSADKTLKLWDTRSGRLLRTFNGHTDAVRAVAFSPDGALLASGSGDSGFPETRDYTVRIWNARTGQLIRTLLGHGDTIQAVAFTADGKWIVSGSGGSRDNPQPENDAIKLWNVADGREVRTIVSPRGSIHSLALDSGDRWLAYGTDAGAVRLVELATGADVRELTGRTASIESLAFSPDGNQLAFGGNADANVRRWDLQRGRDPQTLVGRDGGVHAVAFSSDQRWFAAAGYGDGPWLRLWDRDQREVWTARPDIGSFGSIAFTPDGRQLLLAGAVVVRRWDTESGRELRPLTGPSQSVEAIAISEDGRLLAAASREETVWLWDLARGQPLQPLTGHAGRVLAVAFSPDGRYLAAGGLSDLKIWDLTTRRERLTLSGHPDWIGAIAFSRNGRVLAAGGGGKTIKLWDADTGRSPRTLVGHTGAVTAITFSPDGRWLASASRDGSTRLWDPATGAEMALLTTTSQSDDWLVATPQGLFDGSATGAEQLVAWRMGTRVLPASRFLADYFHPGLLAQVFSGKSPRPAVALANLPSPPDVRIVEPTTGRAFKEPRLVLKVEAYDRGGGLADVRLLHNGKAVGVRQGTAGAQSTYSFDVALVAGENIFEAVGTSRDRAESNKDRVRIVLEVAAPPRPALHVLAVGVNLYQDSAFNLDYARPDAEAIARFFETRAGRLFGAIDTTKLMDHDATRPQIEQAFAALAQRAQPNDVVLVYLAGHGVGIGQQFYFLPHETRRDGGDQEASVRKYGIPATMIGDALFRLKALKQVLILDTCQSEGALPLLTKTMAFRGLGFAEERALRMLSHANGVHLIAASTKQQYAYEIKELGHGVLGYALLTGLENEAPTGVEGIVTVLSLLQYVNQKVPELATRYHGGDIQTPVFSSTGTDFPLWIR
jgi:WD40 repeat protein